MAEITAALVRSLRDETNLGMMECKKALVEAGGDKEQAVRILRERGLAHSTKRASRAANQGKVASTLQDDGKIGSLVEVNSETDFVARNEMFGSFVQGLADQACETDGDLAELAKAEVAAKIAETGENIVIRRNTRYILDGTGIVASYIHLGGKVGVLVEVGCGKEETVQSPVFKDVVKDLTMHIAATDPAHLNRDEVPADALAAEREIFAKQVEDKPADIVDKIVDGKMNKYYAAVCLLDQGFVKEPKQSVSKLLADKGKELDDALTVRRFARYQLGQE